jgi:hypothetical protein
VTSPCVRVLRPFPVLRPCFRPKAKAVARGRSPARIARFCEDALPRPRWPGECERRSDMARADEFENLPSFRAQL